MLVGTADVDITPDLGASLAGYFHDRHASGIYDPLYAKALVAGNDNDAVAIVALDLIGLRRAEVEKMRQRAHELCGIRPERIMVASTHTHLGPVTIHLFQSTCDLEWLATVPEKGAQAVAQAWRARRECTFAIATGSVETISFNRRFWMKSGVVETNPGRLNPDIVRAAGPIDPEVGVLVWGKPKAPEVVLVNFTCHLDTIGGDVISADYPAYMAAAIRAVLGDVGVVFVNGAFGDINHVDVHDRSPRSGIEQAKWMGEVLATEVLRVIPAAKSSASQTLDERHRLLEIPLRPLADDVVQAARRECEAAPREGELNAAQMYAREVVLLAESESPTVAAEVQALRLGDAAFVGLPGEPFVELGLRLKQGSPFPHTYVAGLANGCEGYIPTRAAFDEGGYEVRTARSSKLHPEAGDTMVAAGAELLGELWARR
jgi:neutral ceramidase